MHHDPKIERDDDRAGHASTSTSIWWPGARTSAILLLCCSSCRLAGSFTEQVTRDVEDCKPPLLFRIRLEICLNEGVKVVTFFWGDPAPYVERVHRAGALVTHTVGSAEEARRVVDAGVDIVIAQGWEAGGHVWGQVGTMALVPAVVDAVDPVPVVAAGGIGDGRGLAAVLMLGGSGVWLGTRFLASVEAEVHQVQKEMVLRLSEQDTVYGQAFNIGWENAPHRTLRNSTVRAWEAAGSPKENRPGEGEVIAANADGTPVVRYSDIMPGTDMTGDLEALACYGGQSTGLIHSIEPAATIIRTMVDEATEALARGVRMA